MGGVLWKGSPSRWSSRRSPSSHRRVTCGGQLSPRRFVLAGGAISILKRRLAGGSRNAGPTPKGGRCSPAGAVIDLAVARLLVLSWADDDWPAATRVEVRLAEADGMTAVRLLHTGWGAVPDGAALADEHRVGWRLHLDNLRRCIEGSRSC